MESFDVRVVGAEVPGVSTARHLTALEVFGPPAFGLNLRYVPSDRE